MYRGDGETQKLVLWIGLGKMMESFIRKGENESKGAAKRRGWNSCDGVARNCELEIRAAEK
jgi:hypothetical protein